MPSPAIVTRFAPSPTGFLHIGGARTALFNYLYAKKHGGQFKLRIEDTDKARSTAEATQAIIDGLAWMELPHDGDIVYQSKNAQNHIDAANAMVASGHAYRCYLSAEDPLIHGPDGKKLSKRHGALGAEAYRDDGYIPSGLRNYLMKLGWSHGDQEIFTDEEAIAAFDLSGIVKSAARLDFEKMAFVNGKHIEMSDDADIMARAKPFFQTENPNGYSQDAEARVLAAMPDIKKFRLKPYKTPNGNPSLCRPALQISPPAMVWALVKSDNRCVWP